MALISLSELLAPALSNQYAIPAFNINFQHQVEAILDAGEQQNSPMIVQISSGGLSHMPSWMILSIVQYLASCHLPICLHRDHCHSIDEVKQAIDLGFTSIMIDGSLKPDGTPSTFEENVLITQQAIALARPHGISIEGEIGCLGSLETGLSGEEDGTQAKGILTADQMLTDPSQAKQFVEETAVDALAIAIGTSHGCYKFSSAPTDKTLNIKRVHEISTLVPDTPLVLHGSSSVPEVLLNKINAHGGSLPETYGVPVSSIQQAIQHGVCKVNIDTDLRLASTAAIRMSLASTPENIDPRAYLGAAKKSMQDLCAQRFNEFGCQDKASGGTQ